MALNVLDTDTLTLLRAGNARISERVLACPPADLAITVITVEEQITGWYTLLRRATTAESLSRAYGRLADTVVKLSRFQILAFPVPAVESFHRLRALKLGVGTMDLRIAAITLHYGGTLVTRNRRDFERVPGLAFEDWTVQV
ncbi:MAG TPA: type II toxin-antitoxin system VapC family toxin [Armatimonadota bacterium]|nr:type II toxin-antitoxin system VapC family toxin [Armatimonadota bacterium]